MTKISPFFLIIVILIQVLLIKLLPIYTSKLENTARLYQLKHKLTSRFYLSQLYDYEFIDYCKYFLENMGFKNIEYNSNHSKNGVIFNCQSVTGETFYISAYQSFLNDERGENVSDIYTKIGKPYIQLLLGSMIHDGVKNGMIITNGDFTESALQFSRTLPSDYYIKPLDGINLSKHSWNLYYRNLATIKRSVI